MLWTRRNWLFPIVRQFVFPNGINEQGIFFEVEKPSLFDEKSIRISRNISQKQFGISLYPLVRNLHAAAILDYCIE